MAVLDLSYMSRRILATFAKLEYWKFTLQDKIKQTVEFSKNDLHMLLNRAAAQIYTINIDR